MKKILLLTLAIIATLCFAFSLSACNNNEASVCTVTFVYLDNTTVTKQVNKGETLTEIPELPTEKGYTYSWDISSFENISKDLTVTAVKTLNEYVISINANGGTISSEECKVNYNGNYTLPIPEKSGHRFNKWVLDNGSEFASSGVFTLDNNVTVNAVYFVVHQVTFKQEGFDDIVIEVIHGEAVENVPMPVKTDKDWIWNVKDFSNIVDDMTIEAIEAVYYTVSFNIGSYSFSNDDVRTFDINSDDCLYFPMESVLVSLGGEVALFTPQYYGYKFKHWTYEGQVFDGLNYNFEKNITITAVWEYDENSPRWDSIWA